MISSFQVNPKKSKTVVQRTFKKVEQKYNILVLKSDIVKTDGS